VIVPLLPRQQCSSLCGNLVSTLPISPLGPCGVLAVHDLVSSSHPSIRAAVNYLGITQHIEAPELTNPARMPECLSSRKVSKALEAAINVKYAGQLLNNASVDTTYIQVGHTVLVAQQSHAGPGVLVVQQRRCRSWWVGLKVEDCRLADEGGHQEGVLNFCTVS